MSILEIVTEDKVTQWCKSNGILCEKVKFVTAGYPDRLYVLPTGVHVWIEYKRKGEEPEPIQMERLRGLRERVIFAGWTDEYVDAINFLKAILGATRLPDTGDQITALTILWGIILGSGAGKNFRLPSNLQNFTR